MAVLDDGCRAEDHSMAPRRQPEGKLLIFQIVEAFVEASTT